MRSALSSNLELPSNLKAIAVAILGVLGMTVLAFAAYSLDREAASPGPLMGTLIASGLAIVFLFRRGQVHLELLEEQAHSDSLCGLPNRRSLHQDIARFARRDTEIALALIDLDGFKAVNDFYGHVVGDRVLKFCAGLFSELCEGHGRAYRLGGDEFALVAVGPLAGNILEGICFRLLKRMAEPIMIDDRLISIGASIGLSRGSTRGGPDSSELLRMSDVAMYASKARGKARTTWFAEEFDTRRQVQQRIDTDLREALKAGELRLHYQPLIDAETRRVNSVEALLRWERPDGERIGPDVFIPVAEETGLIDAIGLWVLRQACTDAMAWDGIKLSVNVSAAQLRNPQFPIHLGQILEETGFPPSRLDLEITETYVIGDPVMANRNLELVRDFGVGIVLDDYGTGFASIGFLRKFRFEKLKLDRSLLVDSVNDDSTRAVMASSVAIAKALGMKVTAEGVETETHADLARVAGCDQMQGWLYSRAIPADELAQFLDDSNALLDAAPPLKKRA